jgi:hypothetical protein
MSYFKHFQKVDYDVRGNGFTQKLTNLTQMSKIGTKILDDISLYNYYNIQEGERPDNVSYKLYGTVDYYWTFFLINQHLVNSFNDWPKDTAALKEFVESKYMHYAAISEMAQIEGAGFQDISEVQTELTSLNAYLLTLDQVNDATEYGNTLTRIGELQSLIFAANSSNIAGKFIIGETVRGGVSDALGIIKAKYPSNGYVVIEPTSGTFAEGGEVIYGITSQDSITAQSVVKHAYAPKHWTDNSTGDIVSRRSAGTSPYTFFNYEYDENIAKSRIRVIKPSHVGEVARIFSREMKNKS